MVLRLAEYSQLIVVGTLLLRLQHIHNVHVFSQSVWLYYTVFLFPRMPQTCYMVRYSRSTDLQFSNFYHVKKVTWKNCFTFEKNKFFKSYYQKCDDIVVFQSCEIGNIWTKDLHWNFRLNTPKLKVKWDPIASGRQWNGIEAAFRYNGWLYFWLPWHSVSSTSNELCTSESNSFVYYRLQDSLLVCSRKRTD